MEITQKEILDARLEGIKDSQTRTRLALFFLILVCASILGGIYNLYFSWDRSWTYGEESPTGYARKILMDDTIKLWHSNSQVGIPMIGIKFSFSDVPFIGPIFLFIFSYYYHLCVRREYYEIKSILKDAFEQKSLSIKKYIYHRVKSNMIFTTVKFKNEDVTRISIFSDKINTLLVFLPLVTIVLIVLSDLYFATLYDSPWRTKQNDFRCLTWDYLELAITWDCPDLAIIWNCQDLPITWNYLEPTEKYQLVIMDLFTMSIGFIIYKINHKSYKFKQEIEEKFSNFIASFKH